MRYVSLLLCTIGLISCHQPGYQIRTYHENGYTLADTLLHGNVRSIPFDAYARYAICYIGPDSGRIATGKPLPRSGRTPDPGGYLARKFDSNYMTIHVDTSHTQLQFEHSHFDTANNRRIVDSVSFFNAMRITLKNVSDSLLYLGNFNTLGFAYLEMQNGKKDWIRIENPSSWYSYCSTGARANYLRPGEILIAKFPRYEGEFTANFRVVWEKYNRQKICSNEFVAPVSDLMLNIVDLKTERYSE